MSKIYNKDVARLKALQDCGVSEQPINSVFEKITRMAKLLFKVPIVSVTVLAKDKQLLKSVQGLDVEEPPLMTHFVLMLLINHRFLL